MRGKRVKSKQRAILKLVGRTRIVTETTCASIENVLGKSTGERRGTKGTKIRTRWEKTRVGNVTNFRR